MWLKRNPVAFGTAILFVGGYCLLFMINATTMSHVLVNLVGGYLLAWGLYGMLSDLPRLEKGTRFLLTTSTIGIFLLLAEGPAFLRVVDYRAVFGTFSTQHPLDIAGRQFDPELLWQNQSYYHFVAHYQGNLGRALCIPPSTSHEIEVRYDEKGHRNSPHLRGADIAVIGDSYIEAAMTADAELHTTLLSALQGKTVANLGLSGYGPQQELAVLKRFALPLNPKTIIWAFFEGNDIANALEYERLAPTLSRGNGLWEDFWFRSLTRNVVAIYSRSTSTCVPSPHIARYRAEFKDQKNISTPVFFSPSEALSPSHPTLRRAVAPIVEAAKLCRDRHIRFIVAYVPEKYRVYHDLPNVALSTEEVRSWTVDDLPARFQRLLSELSPDIEYVDLTPALKAASSKGIATYLPDDTHWSTDGHRVVAKEFNRVLMAPASPRSEDLARRLP